jgi:hypothetical protein
MLLNTRGLQARNRELTKTQKPMKEIAYDTLSQATSDLKKRGYEKDFDLKSTHLIDRNAGIRLEPHEFEIDEVHRFEGMTNPADSTVVYAVSSSSKEVRGVVVDAYGAYSEKPSAEMISKFQSNKV